MTHVELERMTYTYDTITFVIETWRDPDRDDLWFARHIHEFDLHHHATFKTYGETRAQALGCLLEDLREFAQHNHIDEMA